jgi:hypothetical protein
VTEANYYSDLLIRHQRLTHGSDAEIASGEDETNHTASSRPHKRRKRTLQAENDCQQAQESPIPSPDATTGLQNMASPANMLFDVSTSLNQSNECSLTTLSMAAEYTALQGIFGVTSAPTQSAPDYRTQNEATASLITTPGAQESIPAHGFGFEESLDNLAAFLDTDTFSSYNFSSLMSTEQPMVLFSPESFAYADDMATNPELRPESAYNQSLNLAEEPNSFSRFGSRLPSLQPEERPDPGYHVCGRRLLSEISSEDRKMILEKLSSFSSVLPPDFQLPSRLALSRYIAAYVTGFHEHLPFLHIPTMSIEHCSVELILAMAAVGTQYCFEGEKGIELFNVSQAIASCRIRRRDAGLANLHQIPEPSNTNMESVASPNTQCPPIDLSTSGPLGLPSEPEISFNPSTERDDLIQTAQALLILMAMATWAKHRKILREALAIQSILATLIRDDGLKNEPLAKNVSWEEWVRFETTKRTKLIVFCFFNLHCIVYNIPPLILNTEIKLALPSSAAEFKASNAGAWREAKRKVAPGIGFQEALRRLFSRRGRDITEYNSSLGNYVLIHALIQHIFFVRQIAKYRFDRPGDLASEDISSLEHALRNWQSGWKRNPESSLDPMDPNGPVAFNSTALLRLAYIRLNIDTGPYRSLDTRDPVQIANAFRESPPIQRTPKLVRAVLHSAHALSVPVKIGIRLVAKTQTFIWSIQHSLCSLECAFLLSKWLEALSLPNPEPPVTDDEWRIRSLVKTMLDETEFATPEDGIPDSTASTKSLSAGVLRVWAAIFKGAQTWAIVDVIGSALNIYADMLESNTPDI